MLHAYSEDELLGVLRAFAMNLPDMRLGELYEQSFYPAIVHLFGDVETALTKAKLFDWPVLAAAAVAGVNLADHNRRWSRESLIEALRDRMRDRKSLRASDVQREDNALYQSARAYFGSYPAACRAARSV